MLIGYLITAIILFLMINYLEQNLKIKFLHEVILVSIYFLTIAGIFYEMNISTYYLYAIMLIVSMVEIFLLYYKELSTSRNPYSFYKYIFLVAVIYLINRLFIDKVKGTFLSLEELKAFIWILVFLYLYWYLRRFLQEKSNKIMLSKIKDDYLMIQYVHLKNEYYQIIKPKNKNLTPLIYSIILYENIKRPFILRKIDIILYRLDGIPRKFGIMQIKNKTVLSDVDSIKRGIKRIEIINKQLSPNLKNIQKNIKILEKYHYQKEEVKDIINIYQKINLFESK